MFWKWLIGLLCAPVRLKPTGVIWDTRRFLGVVNFPNTKSTCWHVAYPTTMRKGDMFLHLMQSGRMALLLIVETEYHRSSETHTFTTTNWRYVEPNEQFEFAN